ncbi:MAG TPA: alpha/beta hydrolase [Geminicoccaceae bacterium]|nr:alpha/beta hydrolase [Geminicoccaceae bacterium]
MAYAQTDDGVRLYYEEAGAGVPVVFVHEFAGDHRSWESQMRFFSRRNRCIAYAARGYPPSDVPEDVASYGQTRAAADILAVMDGAGVERAHVVGLSMGAFATLHLGLDHPERALSLVVAGIGYGAEKQREAEFRANAEAAARGFEAQGSRRFAEIYGSSAARVQFEGKDPRGWREMVKWLGEHDPKGAANTMRGVQARRPSLYDLEERLRRLALPTLIVAGDEDDQTLQPGIFLKRTIPASGLMVLPKTGHTINLEEPAAFNQAVADFHAQVAAGRWLPRDPRARPDEILKTS